MKILVPVDGGLDCRKAIEFLSARAKWLNDTAVKVELLYVAKPIEDPVEQGNFYSSSANYEAEHELVLSRMKHELDAAGFAFTHKLIVGHPAKIVPEYAKVGSFDLIVMGARGLSMVKNLYMGSVSLTVVAQACCPVMLCRYESEEQQITSPMHIGVAVDGSAFGPRSVEFIGENQGFFGDNASYELLHVTEAKKALSLGVEPTEALKMNKKVPKMHAMKLEVDTKPTLDVFKEYKIDAKVVSLEGPVQKALVDYTNEHLDLIVMGSHGKGALRSLVFGSCTRAMVADSRKTVLIIPKRN